MSHADDLFGHLMGLIYDAGVGASRWDDVLEALRAAIGSETGALFLHDRSQAAVEVGIEALSGYSADHITEYRTHFASRNFRIRAAGAFPVGTVLTDGREIPLAQVAASTIHNEFYRPIGLGQSLGFLLFAEGDRVGVLSSHRAERAGSFNEEAVRLVQRLSPHIVRSLQVQRQVARARALSGAFSVALDHFALPVLLVEGDGRVAAANDAAERMLASPGCPLQKRHGLIEAVRGPDAAALRRLVHAATQPGAGVPSVLHLAGLGGGGTLAVMGAPLRRGDVVGFRDRPLAALFVSEPGRANPADEALLVRQFGLTEAEATVVSALCAGSSTDAIAAARRVSRETVRAQVKAVMTKMDLSSRGQVVGTVSRSLASLRRPAMAD